MYYGLLPGAPRLLFCVKALMGYSSKCGTYKGTNDEYPESCNGSGIAVYCCKYCGSDASCRVYAGSGKSDTYDVYEGKGKSDNKSAE